MPYLLSTLIEVECWHAFNLTGLGHILSITNKKFRIFTVLTHKTKTKTNTHTKTVDTCRELDSRNNKIRIVQFSSYKK